jgi:predicted HTH transcriptional regulator
MHPHRLERYRICGMCSECQYDWMPDLFQEEVGTVIAPEDRVKKQTKDMRFLKSRSTLLKHWHVMENTTIKVLQKRSKLNASTIMTQIKYMMKRKEVNEILVSGRQTFTLMKEVEDELSEM